MSHSLHGTFVSEKINKIRWRPDSYNSHFFVTGSIDNVENNIKLWDFCENVEEDDIYPFLVYNLPYCGDITEIKVTFHSINNLLNIFFLYLFLFFSL